MSLQPGLVILLSSGETSASGRRIYEWLFRQLEPPISMVILETPAGFQPNSKLVADKVASYIEHHLQNHTPRVTVVPARQRNTPYSPDNAEIASFILGANVLYMGAGSPTYAVRQLQGSLTWHTMLARHRQGAALVLTSAAAIAVGVQALPVYEIYKVGVDLHWSLGLNLLGPYGLPLVLVSHWDNNEGGQELDTSRAFIGRTRFAQLKAMLPPHMTIVGLDEHTALALDLAKQECLVMGRGGVCVCRDEQERHFLHGERFALHQLGSPVLPDPTDGIPPDVWQRTLEASKSTRADQSTQPPSQVLTLVEQREKARRDRDWTAADTLRRSIEAMGWEIRDSTEGPQLVHS